MKLENQVCSLDLANRLKELGVKQESLYDYCLWSVQDDGEAPTTLQPYSKTNRIASSDFCSAFTVAEFGEILHGYLPALRDYADSSKPGNCWKAILPDGREYTLGLDDRVTEADARANMLVYLLENNLITL